MERVILHLVSYVWLFLYVSGEWQRDKRVVTRVQDKGCFVGYFRSSEWLMIKEHHVRMQCGKRKCMTIHRHCDAQRTYVTAATMSLREVVWTRCARTHPFVCVCALACLLLLTQWHLSLFSLSLSRTHTSFSLFQIYLNCMFLNVWSKVINQPLHKKSVQRRVYIFNTCNKIRD